jgi:hypothetical protein
MPAIHTAGWTAASGGLTCGGCLVAGTPHEKGATPMKKLTLLALAMLASTQALAADPIEKQVTVSAVIPTTAFYVEPFGGNWMNDVQELGYQPTTDTLLPVRKQLQAKSTVGPIEALLINDAAISNGPDSIPLVVSIAGTTLTTTAKPIMTDVTAAKILDFQVDAPKPSGGFKPGTHQGVVNMMFQTAAP